MRVEGPYIRWLQDQLIAKLLKHFVDSLVLLRANEAMQDRAALRCQVLALILGHNSAARVCEILSVFVLGRQVALVANYHFQNVLWCLFLDVIKPDLFDYVE